MKKGTVAIITNTKGEYLLLKRPSDHHSFPDQWTLPGGKVDSVTLPNLAANYVEEALEIAAYREAIEETGIKMKAFKQLPIYLTDDKFLVYAFYSVHSHSDEEVTVTFPNREHTEYGWFAIHELPVGTSGMVVQAIREYEGHIQHIGEYKKKRLKSKDNDNYVTV